MDKTRQLEGFFLEFESDEIKDVREELINQGYTADGTGMKEFLMDALFSEEEVSDSERVISKARKFIDENPATVQFGMNAIAGLAKMVTRRAARR